MPIAFRPKAILCAALSCALGAILPAGAKTFERFNFSVGAGGTLSDPGLWIGKELGYGFVFAGPGVDLFENRLTLQLDLGISDAMSGSDAFERDYSRYTTYRDTLFRTETRYTYRYDETRATVSYTGALNFDAWSFYGGSLVLWSLIETENEGADYRSYSTGDSLESFHSLDSTPFKDRARFALGHVMAVYGAARRFGRVSVFVQGIDLVSLQAGVRLSLRPLGKTAPHGAPE